MNVDEIYFLEELMDGVRHQRADAEYRLERVAPRTEMGDFPEEFHAVPLILQRIIRSRRPLHNDFLCMDFERLLRLRCQNQGARDPDGGGQSQPRNLPVIINGIRFINYLYRFEKRSVIQRNEAELVGTAVLSDPAPHGDFTIRIFLRLLMDGSEFDILDFHLSIPLVYY